jgi:hypothetical protein
MTQTPLQVSDLVCLGVAQLSEFKSPPGDSNEKPGLRTTVSNTALRFPLL